MLALVLFTFLWFFGLFLFSWFWFWGLFVLVLVFCFGGFLFRFCIFGLFVLVGYLFVFCCCCCIFHTGFLIREFLSLLLFQLSLASPFFFFLFQFSFHAIFHSVVRREIGRYFVPKIEGLETKGFTEADRIIYCGKKKSQ